MMRIWLALWDVPDGSVFGVFHQPEWRKQTLFGLNADFFGFYRITKQQSAYLCYDHTHTMRGVFGPGIWDWDGDWV